MKLSARFWHAYSKALRPASAGVGRPQKADLRARIGRRSLPVKDGDLRTAIQPLASGPTGNLSLSPCGRDSGLVKANGARATPHGHPSCSWLAAESALNVAENEVDSESQSTRPGDQPYPLPHRKSAYSCKSASVRLSGLRVNHLTAPLENLVQQLSWGGSSIGRSRPEQGRRVNRASPSG
jgi:hypothetical protein